MNKKTNFIYLISLIFFIGIFYHINYKPYMKTRIYRNIFKQTQYSYDQFLNEFKRAFSYGVLDNLMIKINTADIAMTMLREPKIDSRVAVSFGDFILLELGKEFSQMPENYLVSVKLAELLLNMAIRDLKYLPDAEAMVRHCMAISPFNPYSKELFVIWRKIQ